MQRLFLYAVHKREHGFLGVPTGNGKGKKSPSSLGWGVTELPNAVALIDVREVALIPLRIASATPQHNGRN